MGAFDIQSPLPARKPILENGEELNQGEKLVLPEKKREDLPPEDVVSEIKTPKVTKAGLPGWAIWAFIGLVVLLIIFVVTRLLLPGLAGKPTVSSRTLVYWGLWENSNIMSSVISEFEAKNPGVKVNYQMVNKKDYRSRLQARLEKTGEADVPDVFRIHSSWLPMFSGQLEPVPAETVSSIGLETDYYEVTRELKIGGRYYAVPLMYDNLALFYNKNITEAAQATLPVKTWWGFEKLARKLTVRDDKDQLTSAGAAIGTAGNVDHWSDIIGLLMKQNGANPYLVDAQNTEKLNTILTYYTNYRTKDPVWDETMPNSTQAFAQGKVALYFAPSWRAFDINAINPSLEYRITTVPQLPTLAGADPEAIERGEVVGNLTDKQWATYWVEGVSKNSPNKQLAWEFLKFLSTKESLQKIYSAAAQTREFGPIYPRKSMKELVANNARIEPFVRSADSASSWYLASFTFDAGLNDGMAKYFEDAINSFTKTSSAGAATVTTLQNGVVQLQQRYKLTLVP